MEELGFFDDPTADAGELPPGAAAALRSSNPRLAELRSAYAGHPAAGHTQWTDQFVSSDVDLGSFRGDNAYVSQRLGTTAASYALATQYVIDNDPAGLLDRLDEDGLFGAVTHDIAGRVVSRDLLDSVLEITFLHERLDILDPTPRTVLDIGAGYGRLAHRLATVAPHLTYLCTDAVAESTFLCEYYTAFRQLPNVEVIPLHEIEGRLEAHNIDLAINVHSFSEMPLSAIEFWLDLISTAEVPELFIVPNVHDRLYSREEAHGEDSGIDVVPLLEERGYRFADRRPKYAKSPVAQQHGVFPATHWHLRRK